MINPSERKKTRISQDFPSNSSFSFSGFSAKKAIPVKIRSLASSPLFPGSNSIPGPESEICKSDYPSQPAHAGVFSSVLFSRLVPDERGRHVVHVRATSIRFHSEIDRENHIKGVSSDWSRVNAKHNVGLWFASMLLNSKFKEICCAPRVFSSINLRHVSKRATCK